MAMKVAPQIETNDSNNFMEALELEHLIGMTCNYTNSLIIDAASNKYIYSIGPTVIIADNQEQNNQITLRDHDTPISCLSISDCGTMIASGQYGSHLLKDSAVVNLYDAVNYKLIHSFTGLYNGVHKVLFSPDSKFLIAIDLNGLFIIWDCKTFETIFATQINVSENKKIVNIDSCQILNVINDDNFGDKGRHNIYKILISYQYNLYLWTLQYSVKHMEYILSKKEKFAFPPNRTFNRILTHLDSIKIDDSSNNFLIAATTNIGEIYLFNSSDTNNIYIDSFQACSQGANIVLFIDKNTIIIGGGDGTVKQFIFNHKMKQWILLKGIKLDSSINTLKCNKSYIYATTIQSNVYQIDINTLSFKLLFQSPCNPISKIVFGKFNHIFASLTSSNGILTIWDLSNYLSFAEIKYVANGTALTYYGEDKILTGFDNGTIVCNHIDFKNGGRDTKILWEIKNAHRGKVNCISICNDSKGNILLLSGGDDGLLNVWNYTTKQLISQYHIMIECVLEIVKDPKYREFVHLLGSNGQIATFSLKREGIVIRRMIKNHKENFGKLTYLIQNNHDEFELISSTSNGYLLIWDHELTELIEYINCKQILNLQPHEHLQIISIALSNNSKYLCFGNHIGQIFIISLETRKLITRHDVHSNAVTSIAWTPDDKQIISAGDSSIAVSNFYT